MKWQIYILMFLCVVPFVLADAVMVGRALLYDDANPLLGSSADKIALIIPAVMLLIAVVSLMIDFGTVGVTLGAMATLLILWLTKIVPLNISGIVSIVFLGAILLFKLRA